jgi:exosortase/archaeosortase family protein
MSTLQLTQQLKTLFFSPTNKPKAFYILAFVPLVAIAYFHFDSLSAFIIPLYGFLLLALKKTDLFSHNEAKPIQQTIGLILLVISPIAHLPLLPVFPWAIYYGAFNYALYILGLFLVFFEIPALRKALGPLLLIIVPSVGRIFSDWAQPYFTPFLPPFAILVVGIVSVLGIKATISTMASNWVVLYTPHGPVTYSIVWACIGFESALLFSIVLIIMLFENPGTKKSKLLWAVVGLAGTLILNVFRVALIFVTEYFYTTYGSAQVHNYAGYILFLTWVTVFIYLYSKRESLARRLRWPWIQSTH